MLQVRQSCFETNSSSTHAICIPQVATIGREYTMTFRVGRYGWEEDSDDGADYLYTAICTRYGEDEEELQKALNHIREVLAPYDIKCEFIEPKWSFWRDGSGRYLDSEYGYIDHECEFYPLMDELFSNNDLLVRYLSGSIVYTGNDNCYDNYIDDIVSEYEAKGYYVFEKGN